jgi:hypothetical protein
MKERTTNKIYFGRSVLCGLFLKKSYQYSQENSNLVFDALGGCGIAFHLHQLAMGIHREYEKLAKTSSNTVPFWISFYLKLRSQGRVTIECTEVLPRTEIPFQFSLVLLPLEIISALQLGPSAPFVFFGKYCDSLIIY